MSGLHIFGPWSAESFGRLHATRKMRKRFKGCTCQTYLVVRYYDCAHIYHRKYCRLTLVAKRRRESHSRRFGVFAWGTA